MRGVAHHVRALGRMRPGQLSKTQAAYAASLGTLQAYGDVVWFRFEGLKLRLADNTFYTPDFTVMKSGGAIECHEVKGFWTDDARVKIKVAAEAYPIEFMAMSPLSKMAGGGWKVERF